MKNPINDLQHFLFLVENMRGRQRAYFTTRNETNLSIAKSAERDVDQALQNLKKKGYKAEKIEESKQQKIF